jgi:hypothetical protein
MTIQNKCPWQLPDCKIAECYAECRQNLTSALIQSATEAENFIIEEIASIRTVNVPYFVLQRPVVLNGAEYIIRTEIKLNEKPEVSGMPYPAEQSS